MSAPQTATNVSTCPECRTPEGWHGVAGQAGTYGCDQCGYEITFDCPAWCAGPDDHARALAEGVELDFIEHRSVDLGVRLETLLNPHQPRQILRDCPASVAMALTQDVQTLPFGGYPVIELEVASDHSPDTRLQLTTSEARSLAAMLTRLADQEELYADRAVVS